ncbi:MAG: efflux RND transporter periplasmic adaptor subunit [Planctomycetia bacterium]|nr:efflux RND transporter periplasmic adaptor subunit [Planctomycetia bacterium]
MKTAFLFALVVLLAGGGLAYYTTHGAAEPEARFRTATVERDELLATIGATGTVEPEEVVDVGAQVVGRIKSLGVDPADPNKTIDYGSVVQEDTVLARIDDAIYRAQVDQAEASLLRAQADLLQAEAKRYQTQQDWNRAQSLLPTKSIAKTDYDLDEANYKAADAAVAVGKAMIKQDEAMLRLAKTNLDYTVIKSPVTGVIVDRRVNIGQTVVASFNAPSLFLIAKDLRRMQVWASVNEADIGRIHKDMPVRFTVDAYPGEVFLGKVAQIRLNATMTQNVVTYTVVISTDNSDLKLLPYLTANVQFVLEARPNVLLVPNAALRWRPLPEQMVPAAREAVASASSGEGGQPPAKPARDAAARLQRGRVWVPDGKLVRPIEVAVGISDGSVTEVSPLTSGEVKEGTDVVVAEIRAEGDTQTTNPFMPNMFGGGKKQQ